MPDEPVLNCDVLPIIERAGRIVPPGKLGYADALRGFIPEHVVATADQTGSGLRLEFEDGSIVLHPRQEDLVGPEIALLGGCADGRWMCWRPSEVSFEDLA